jgi:1,4-alpha-glucan branching enzyme
MIHERERIMEQLVAAVDAGDEQRKAVLAQAARELVLLESSDWPFLVTTGQAKEYAIERFTEHVKRFDQLAALATQETAYTNDQVAFLSGLRDRDNPFPDIDIYAFSERQGHAEKRAGVS